jgi:hypothetical protein
MAVSSNGARAFEYYKAAFGGVESVGRPLENVVNAAGIACNRQLRFLEVISSCPESSMFNNSVRAGMSLSAAVSSSFVPKPSRVPWTNKAGV